MRLSRPFNCVTRSPALPIRYRGTQELSKVMANPTATGVALSKGPGWIKRSISKNPLDRVHEIYDKPTFIVATNSRILSQLASSRIWAPKMSYSTQAEAVQEEQGPAPAPSAGPSGGGSGDSGRNEWADIVKEAQMQRSIAEKQQAEAAEIIKRADTKVDYVKGRALELAEHLCGRGHSPIQNQARLKIFSRVMTPCWCAKSGRKVWKDSEPN